MSPTQPEDGVQELSADAHARRINEWMAGFEVSITTAVNSMRVARREAPHPMPPPVRVTVEVGQHPSAERSLRAAVTGDKNGEPTEPKRRSTLKANEHGQYPASAVPVRAPVAGGVVSNPVGPKRRGAPLDAPRQCPAASKSARAAVAGGMVSDPIDLTENDAPEPKRRRTRQYPPTLLPQYQAAVSTVAAPADSPAAAFSSAPTWPYGDLTASMGAHARYGSTGIPTSMPQGVPGMTATAAAPVMPLRTPLSDAPAWSYKYPAALRHRGNAAGGCSFPWSRQGAPATQLAGTYFGEQVGSSFRYQQPQRQGATFPRLSHSPARSYMDLSGFTGAYRQSQVTEMTPFSRSSFGAAQ
ncbi:hypothetical protein B0A55_11264 [Friedmanniomyces simplex]|uniref:Uncharacterized protein n=1 Tax=Friedmanniomyces simplex TaxID=329884 RepID=A0A4U0WJA2_9PEZI|nr:hypothetical protein B0A55_11264 [Friedmanniomyces simplex]